MANKWGELSIAEAPIEIIDGDRGINYPKQDDFSQTGFCLFLNAGNVTNTGFNFSDCSFISEDKDAALRKGKAQRDDVVLTTRGTVGNVALYDASIPHDHIRINSGMVLLRADKSKLLPKYLYQFVRSSVFKERVAALTTGSAQPQLPIRDINRIELPLPPLEDQRAIAHILGTLDDKIELNRKQNETLEAMARTLFKAWFVDFEPVRAKMEGRWQRGQSLPGLPAHLYDIFPDRLVESELGEIPEGWRIGSLGEVALHPRRSVQPNEIKDGTPYIALEHMPKKCIALAEWDMANGLESNKHEFKRGEILFGKLRPYFHKVGIAPVDGVCSTDIVVIMPKLPIWFGFVLTHASSDAFVEYTNAGSTGTKMPRTSWSEMARYTVAMPNENVATTFNQYIQAASEEITSKIHESKSLAQLRDTLLPKLISGELRVPDVERVAGMAV